jgi:hypothetical protein
MIKTMNVEIFLFLNSFLTVVLLSYSYDSKRNRR